MLSFGLATKAAFCMVMLSIWHTVFLVIQKHSSIKNSGSHGTSIFPCFEISLKGYLLNFLIGRKRKFCEVSVEQGAAFFDEGDQAVFERHHSAKLSVVNWYCSTTWKWNGCFFNIDFSQVILRSEMSSTSFMNRCEDQSANTNDFVLTTVV